MKKSILTLSLMIIVQSASAGCLGVFREYLRTAPVQQEIQEGYDQYVQKATEQLIKEGFDHVEVKGAFLPLDLKFRGMNDLGLIGTDSAGHRSEKRISVIASREGRVYKSRLSSYRLGTIRSLVKNKWGEVTSDKCVVSISIGGGSIKLHNKIVRLPRIELRESLDR